MIKKTTLIAYSTLLTFVTHAQDPFNDVAHFYRLDAQGVSDEITNIQAGYIQSTAVTEGVVNGSHAFDNSDTLGLLNFSPNSFTINFWFRTNDANKVQRIFHRGGIGGSAYDRYSYSLVYIPNQGFRFGLGNNTGSNGALIYANPTIDVTNWHMITCSYDQTSQNAKLYIDGNLIISATSTQAIYATPNYQTFLEFSRYPTNSALQTINGNLDEIGLWTRALSDTEVTAAYSQQGTLGINDFSVLDSNAKLFPNPAKNTIQVSNLKTFEHYKIFNLLGQSVKQGVLQNNQNIDINNLDKGVYLIKFKDNATVLRFIKD